MIRGFFLINLDEGRHATLDEWRIAGYSGLTDLVIPYGAQSDDLWNSTKAIFDMKKYNANGRHDELPGEWIWVAVSEDDL